MSITTIIMWFGIYLMSVFVTYNLFCLCSYLDHKNITEKDRILACQFALIPGFNISSVILIGIFIIILLVSNLITKLKNKISQLFKLNNKINKLFDKQFLDSLLKFIQIGKYGKNL